MNFLSSALSAFDLNSLSPWSVRSTISNVIVWGLGFVAFGLEVGDFFSASFSEDLSEDVLSELELSSEMLEVLDSFFSSGFSSVISSLFSVSFF